MDRWFRKASWISSRIILDLLSKVVLCLLLEMIAFFVVVVVVVHSINIYKLYVCDCQIGFFMEITLVNFPVHMRVHNSVKTYLLMEYPKKEKHII